MAKEFRYLRTVRVTAAVYGAFPLQHLPRRFHTPHRAGVSSSTSPHGFAGTCVFEKQSLPPLFCGLPVPATGAPTRPEGPADHAPRRAPPSAPSTEDTGPICRVRYAVFPDQPSCSYTSPPASVSARFFGAPSFLGGSPFVAAVFRDPASFPRRPVPLLIGYGLRLPLRDRLFPGGSSFPGTLGVSARRILASFYATHFCMVPTHAPKPSPEGLRLA